MVACSQGHPGVRAQGGAVLLQLQLPASSTTRGVHRSQALPCGLQLAICSYCVWTAPAIHGLICCRCCHPRALLLLLLLCACCLCQVALDVQVGDRVGRLVLGLYGKVVPKTVRAMLSATGAEGFFFW
jgi:hypothetical protein